MPKAPVTQRLALYTEIRGTAGKEGKPLLQRLPWNAIETEHGPALESAGTFFGNEKVTQIDLTDVAFDGLRIVKDGELQATYLTSGDQILYDYNA